nr:zincin-like metallopeptidase domain-containing protein [Proteus mirabilis]
MQRREGDQCGAEPCILQSVTGPDCDAMSSQFDRDADYWATLLHELVHSTGHQSRLAREGITSSSS